MTRSAMRTSPVDHGGSDGARTRDLRRDRPSISAEKTTSVPTSLGSDVGGKSGLVGTHSEQPPPLDSPENKRPGAAGTAAGAKGHGVTRKGKSTNATGRAQPSKRAQFTITVGRDRLGRVEQVDDEFTAFACPDDHPLGAFATLKAAASAITDASRGEQ
jgi:hypothetical protein